MRTYNYNQGRKTLHISGYCYYADYPTYLKFNSEREVRATIDEDYHFCKKCSKKRDEILKKDIKGVN